MVYLKGFLCDSASRSIACCNIFTNFTMFSTIFVRTNCSVDRTQFNPYYIITDFAGAFRRNHRFRCKSFFNLLIHLKQIKVLVNCCLKNLKSRVGGESSIRPLCQILVKDGLRFFENLQVEALRLYIKWTPLQTFYEHFVSILSDVAIVIVS